MSDQSYAINGYTPTIGIECHVQLKTKSKLFGVMSNDAGGAEPNTLVDQICFGLPGALPVLNEAAVALASRAAFALNTSPQKFSKFDRKHYFYPDLPKGYQISQFDQPIILGGSVTIYLDNGQSKDVAITRAHLEEDAGKSTHPAGADYSLVDLNRAGTPLLEIVSEPELHSPQEAKAYAKALWLQMKYAGVSDVDLYHGNMRFDVNVSVSKDSKQLGTRSETKNLNSFRSVERAVEYEIQRQIKLLEEGGQVVQETRGWLDDQQKTVSQRSKEDAHDYRYFPDPDIPPVVLDDAYIAQVKKNVPVMPDVWRDQLTELGIDAQSVETLIETNAEFEGEFLQLLRDSEPSRAKTYANWLINIEVPMRRLHAEDETSMDSNHRKSVFEGVYDLTTQNKVSSNNAKALIEELLTGSQQSADVEAYANTKGYIQVSDESEIEAVVQTVLDAHSKAVEDIKNGETKAIGFLVGQVMKESKGKANPGLAQQIIKRLIGV